MNMTTIDLPLPDMIRNLQGRVRTRLQEIAEAIALLQTERAELTHLFPSEGDVDLVNNYNRTSAIPVGADTGEGSRVIRRRVRRASGNTTDNNPRRRPLSANQQTRANAALAYIEAKGEARYTHIIDHLGTLFPNITPQSRATDTSVLLHALVNAGKIVRVEQGTYALNTNTISTPATTTTADTASAPSNSTTPAPQSKGHKSRKHRMVKTSVNAPTGSLADYPEKSGPVTRKVLDHMRATPSRLFSHGELVKFVSQEPEAQHNPRSVLNNLMLTLTNNKYTQRVRKGFYKIAPAAVPTKTLNSNPTA